MSIVLGGMEMVLRPTFEAIEAIELKTGKGLLQLARESLAASLTVSECAQISTECVRAWGREVDDENAAGANAKKIAALIIESDGGINAVMGKLAGVLSLASTGGYNAKGELKAAPAKKTDTAADD